MSSRPLKKKKRVLVSFPHSATPLVLLGHGNIARNDITSPRWMFVLFWLVMCQARPKAVSQPGPALPKPGLVGPSSRLRKAQSSGSWSWKPWAVAWAKAHQVPPVSQDWACFGQWHDCHSIFNGGQCVFVLHFLNLRSLTTILRSMTTTTQHGCRWCVTIWLSWHHPRRVNRHFRRQANYFQRKGISVWWSFALIQFLNRMFVDVFQL